MIDDRYVLSPTFNDIYWVEDNSKLLQHSLFYCTDKNNAEIAVNYLNSQENHMIEVMEENRMLKKEIHELKLMNNQLLADKLQEFQLSVFNPGRCMIEPVEIKKENSEEVLKKVLEGLYEL